MREQLKSVRSLRVISIAEAAMIIYLVALLIYLLANISQSTGITITPSLTSDSPTISSPNATSQQPATSQSSGQPVFSNI